MLTGEIRIRVLSIASAYGKAYQLWTLQPLWNYFENGVICLLRQFLQIICNVVFTDV